MHCAAPFGRGGIRLDKLTTQQHVNLAVHICRAEPGHSGRTLPGDKRYKVWRDRVLVKGIGVWRVRAPAPPVMLVNRDGSGILFPLMVWARASPVRNSEDKS